MKTINRYNYEEFFLLYIDNELDAHEREAVEKFVQENADLSVELDMLLQTKSAPEHAIIFANKENLVRTEGDSINETNYEEYLLLYIDNELSISKRLEVETYILQHPKLQADFILLKQAVLQPETISYGNKEELYRTEGRRIIYSRPWRFAAAAVFIGLCALGWWLFQKPGSSHAVAEVDKAIQQPTQIAQPVNPGTGEQQIKHPEVSVQQNTTPRNTVKVTNKKEDVSHQEQPVNILAKSKLTPQIAPAEKNDASMQEISKQHEEPVIAKNDLTKAPDQFSQEEKQPSELLQVEKNIETNNDNGYNVYPVAYKEINTNDDDRSVHVAMLDLNKDKVKSFLKKAGRLFSNKSNDLANEDGKLQVANFEIETNKQ